MRIGLPSLRWARLVVLPSHSFVVSTSRRSFAQQFFKAETVRSSQKIGGKQNPVEEKFTKKFQVNLSQYLRQMQNPQYEKVLAPLREAVREHGEFVRALKEAKAPKVDLDKAVVELKARQKKLAEAELKLAPPGASFDRLKLEDLLKRRFFYDQSFAIYGGVTGLYDLGPMGCALKANMIQLWRKHFIVAEGMLEVDCSVLTPEPVLRASGHVDRFSDWMVKDVKTGECFRADHLIKNHAEKLIADKKVSVEEKEALKIVLAKLDGFNDKDMQEVITKYKFKSPISGNDLTEPIAFNLMFPTVIGPTGDVKAFLRPETAQGIFVNFKRLLEFNQGKLPFAAAQIGSGFRNEISPRQGLIRVREFTMCEIEHFVDPAKKQHPKFANHKDYRVTLLSAENQMKGTSAQHFSIGEAVAKHIVDNETLGYFMVRVHQYLVKVGIDPQRLRFRQHLSSEMAHYARDCWDAEVLTSYGWIECVGNADRSCFDLQQHSKATNVKLTAEKKLEEPRTILVTEAVPNKSAIGKEYKAQSKMILAKLAEFSSEELSAIDKEATETGKITLKLDGGEVDLFRHMFSIKEYEKKVHVEEITPSVIEPSFGIGRIMYAVLEHSFREREGDEQRNFLVLPPTIAPIKVALLPLSSNTVFDEMLAYLRKSLEDLHIVYKEDDSAGSIGRRYARADEIGIPFAITVDFDSLKDGEVTLRELSSMQQLRMKRSDVAMTVSNLCTGDLEWNSVTCGTRLPTNNGPLE